MNGKGGPTLSRREFARRAAIASAVAIAPPGTLSERPSLTGVPEQQTNDLSSLSPESRAEVEARYQEILGIYGTRFSELQKADLRRLCVLAQMSLNNLRKFTIENSDGPALYLKPLVEREKKPGSSATPGVPRQSAVKP